MKSWRLPIACAALLLAFALLTPGCTPSEPRADLVIINGAEPESLDPAIITGQSDMRIVRALFEGLARLNPTNATPMPGLAERWEISPEGDAYTFFLRSNAVWSTGQPITAHDVVYSWIRALDPNTASDYAGQLFYLKNGEAFNSGKIKNPAEVGVRALNDHTVHVDLIGPTPFFLDLCAFPTLAVVPRFHIEKQGDRWLMARPLPTSGPYQLESWRLSDKVRVRKSPRYWDAGGVQNEVVDFLQMESATTALNLYATGGADIIWDKNLIPSDVMDAMIRRPDCHRFDYLGTYFYRYNVTRKPFDDVRVRKALALAVDKRRLVERITRGGEKTTSHFTPSGILLPDGTPLYQPPDGLGYDPPLARKLLADAGYEGGDGFPPFQYLFNTGKIEQGLAVELQAMWQKELGLTVELRMVEQKVYFAAQSALDYEVSRSSWVGDYNDPNTFLDMWMANNGNNRTGWKSARYDELVREGNRQMDSKKREKFLQQAEAILVRDELPIVPLYFYVGINFFDANKIEGLHFNLLDDHPVNTIRKKK